LKSADDATRSVAYRLENVVRTRASGGISSVDDFKPGGRHDNDFEDFRKVAIFPTADELTAKDQPYYLPSQTVLEMSPDVRAGTHLGNQFRLLREDMLAELRDDFHIAKGKKQRRRAMRLSGLVFHGIDCGSDQRRRPPSLALLCHKGLPDYSGLNKAERKKQYADDKSLLKHDSFGCLLACGQVLAFATIERNEDLLAEHPPIILLRIFGELAIEKSLAALKINDPGLVEFVLVETPFFAYEPVLRCLQELASLPLANELLGLDESGKSSKSPIAPKKIIEEIKREAGRNLRNVLGLSKDVILDASQTESFLAGLTHVLSLIQGPPGV